MLTFGRKRHRLGKTINAAGRTNHTAARRTGDTPRRKARAGDESHQRPETADRRSADKVQTRHARFKSARQNRQPAMPDDVRARVDALWKKAGLH